MSIDSAANARGTISRMLLAIGHPSCGYSKFGYFWPGAQLELGTRHLGNRESVLLVRWHLSIVCFSDD